MLFRSEKKQVIDMMKRGLLEDADFKEAFAEVKDQWNSVHEQLAKTKQETFEIDDAVNHVFDVLEHLDIAWGEAGINEKQTLQCLIFPEKPIYDLEKFETPTLSPILETKTAFHEGRSSLVTPRGIEPRFAG